MDKAEQLNQEVSEEVLNSIPFPADEPIYNAERFSEAVTAEELDHLLDAEARAELTDDEFNQIFHTEK